MKLKQTIGGGKRHGYSVAAHHEAGHAVAGSLLGNPWSTIEIDGSAGRVSLGRGELLESSHKGFWVAQRWNALGDDVKHIVADIAAMAGPAAEARYSRQSMFYVSQFGGGVRDYESILVVKKMEATRLARLVVNRCWPLVGEIARWLLEEGVLMRDECFAKIEDAPEFQIASAELLPLINAYLISAGFKPIPRPDYSQLAALDCAPACAGLTTVF